MKGFGFMYSGGENGGFRFFSARSFWCFAADAHGFFRGFGCLNPSIIGVEGVFSAGGFLRFFLSYCPIFFPFRGGRCRTWC